MQFYLHILRKSNENSHDFIWVQNSILPVFITPDSCYVRRLWSLKTRCRMTDFIKHIILQFFPDDMIFACII
jgi:hypothetical protein